MGDNRGEKKEEDLIRNNIQITTIIEVKPEGKPG